MSWGRIVRPGGDNPARPLGSGLAGRIVRPMCAGKSAFITTRCYSPSGVQIWDGDHGNTVFALSVASDGTIFQSGAAGGTAAILGPSLFHDGSDAPLVTAMFPGGRPIWSIKQSIGGPLFSYGIAAANNGYLYCGLNHPSNPDLLVKLTATGGSDTLHLSAEGFYTGLTANLILGRVRCDSSGNVYALSRANNGLLKWVSDTEFWTFSDADDGSFSCTGLGVSSDGIVFAASDVAIFSPTTVNAFYIFNTATSNLSPLTTPPYLAKATVTSTDPLDLRAGYQQAGVSPSGMAIAFNDVALRIEGIAATGTPDSPTVTAGASVASLGGSSASPYTAMAINDSGAYCYSTVRGVTGYSHVIRAADNSLIASLDHGGVIYDAVVLSNGSVIVAGERVAR